MTVRLQLVRSATVDLTVRLESGEFTLTCRRPTFAEVLQSDAHFVKREYAERIHLWRSLVVGWSGLEDDNGSPLVYSPSSLMQAMAIPEFYNGIVDALHVLFVGKGEQEKNSEASGDTSTKEAQPTTLAGNSGADCAA